MKTGSIPAMYHAVVNYTGNMPNPWEILEHTAHYAWPSYNDGDMVTMDNCAISLLDGKYAGLAIEHGELFTVMMAGNLVGYETHTPDCHEFDEDFEPTFEYCCVLPKSQREAYVDSYSAEAAQRDYEHWVSQGQQPAVARFLAYQQYKRGFQPGDGFFMPFSQWLLFLPIAGA